MELELKPGDLCIVKWTRAAVRVEDTFLGKYGRRFKCVDRDGNQEWYFRSELYSCHFPIYREVTNQYGFPQMVDVNDPNEYPVCSTCHADVMPNRGQGTTCDSCDHELSMELSHDDAVHDVYGFCTDSVREEPKNEWKEEMLNRLLAKSKSNSDPATDKLFSQSNEFDFLAK